jgi:hypothetical protein
MNTSISARVLIILSVATIAVAGYFWLTDGEYEEVQVFDPENRQLRLERMHITERWLKRQSRPVEVIQTLQFLETLPAAGQQLIIPAVLGDMPLLDASQLQNWVLRGGHLIAAAPMQLGPADQPFDLNPFGVTSCFDCLHPSEDSEEMADAKTAFPYHGDGGVRVSIKGLGDRPLRLWSQFALSIERPSDKLEQWPSAQGLPMLVRYAFGAGQITIMPSNQWLDNAQMIEPDHARLLSTLVADRSGTVYLQHYSIPGGLLPWLWHQAPAFWLALLALIALWVWHRLPRLGPVLGDPDPLPNQMRDRLRATARFDSKHSGGQSLLEALRDELGARAQRRYPDWHQLSPAQRRERLCQLCPALSPEQVDALLTEQRIKPPDRLIDHLTVQRRLLHAL